MRLQTETDLETSVTAEETSKKIISEDEFSVLSRDFNIMAEKLENNQSMLEELATRDGLTGLYNRRKFEELLEEELHRFQWHGHVVSLLMIDLDNFKISTTVMVTVPVTMPYAPSPVFSATKQEPVMYLHAMVVKNLPLYYLKLLLIVRYNWQSAIAWLLNHIL